MTPEMVGFIGIAALLVLVFLRIWVGFAMALVGLMGYVYLEGWGRAASVVGTEPYSQIASITFTTVPLFVLMGTVISNSGLGKDLYDAASKWIGGIRGGLAMASVAACGAFAAVSGSSTATALSIGKVAYPEMKRYKYDTNLSVGSIAAGGTIGIMIPPSLGFIVYGLITQESIGKLFMAGLIPGILEVFFYLATIFLLCRFKPSMAPDVGDAVRPSLREKISSLKLTGPVVLIFTFVIGGIYFGVFTPTEAGALGAFASIVVVFLARRMKGNVFGAALIDTIEVTAMIVPMLVGAFIFMRFIAVSGLSHMLSEIMITYGLTPAHFIALIIVLYLILGCFFDANAAVLLTLPILYPAVQALGINPIWFGVIVLRLNEIGLITPPIGLNCFVISGALNIPAGTVFRGIIPFLIADIIHLALLIAFPEISLFLTRL
ncbi:MAG TPA: TRAP transporter large permease [Firmicutes bacterium]|jgi:C4-dicarboxylate transporter DctM subunit|nr:TRAP transporter large permease [Bacillota bacterium]